MASLISLINLVFTAAFWIILAGIVLSLVGQAMHARWLYHPVPQAIIRLSDTICAPFRALMERVGLPTRPLDFSPMLAVFALQFAHRMLVSFLLSLG